MEIRNLISVNMLGLAALVLPVTGFAQEESWVDKLVGKWTLNSARSKLPTEYSRYTKSETKVAPHVLRTEIDTVTRPGEKSHRVVTRICDGQEHHFEGLPEAETEICGPDFKVIGKRGGKVWSEMMASFSPDGNTHTVSRKSLNAEGKWVESIAVFERQR